MNVTSCGIASALCCTGKLWLHAASHRFMYQNGQTEIKNQFSSFVMREMTQLEKMKQE